MEGDLRPGGQIHARFTSSWEGPGRVDVCRTMSPGTLEETLIAATLVAEDDKTRLVIEERGIPIDELPFHGAGWQAHVEDLAAEISGRRPEEWRSRWAALTPTYQELAESL